MTTRFTPEQLREMADALSKPEGWTTDNVCVAMLRQAADDAEDSERYREALQNIADLSEAGCALEEIAIEALHPTARQPKGDSHD